MTTFQKLIEHFIKIPEWAMSWATVTRSEFQKILLKMICFVAMLVCLFIVICAHPMTSIVIFRLNISLSPMPMSTTNSQVLSIIWLMSPISKTLKNGLHVVDQQMVSGMTSVHFMRIFMSMLFVPNCLLPLVLCPRTKLGLTQYWCIASVVHYDTDM